MSIVESAQQPNNKVLKLTWSHRSDNLFGVFCFTKMSSLTSPIMKPAPKRKDIRKLTQAEADNLVKAFDLIQKLPPDHPDSFFSIAGYHGEPFRGAGYGNAQWWGGYCNHGNVLFPTWHRAYVLRLEQALQSQVPGVMMAYWNEIDSETTGAGGVPRIFLDVEYKFANGTSIPNPLRSYKLQRPLKDRLGPSFPDADYSKPLGYETVRYPFSGLRGSGDVATTESHNNLISQFGVAKTDDFLNSNVRDWLLSPCYHNGNGTKVEAGTKAKYEACLNAPNYTVFSNTTSAQRWNDDHICEKDYVPNVSLESPHNAIHLAIGGIQIPGQVDAYIQGANGDMGENDTASFDPIFFFHHCFVDLVFWKWQVNHEQTERLEIIDGYPGTNSVDAQGPTPGVLGGAWLKLSDPLTPFKHPRTNAELNSNVRTL
jgi:tyrosinase